MTIDTLTKNLGTLKIATPHTFSYIFTAGEFPVEFTQIAAGCGSCTIANIAKKAIVADESIELKVTFTPNGIGEQTKKITVTYTEDGNTLKYEVSFTATVIM